jgi:hypothetical protein
MHFSMLYFDSTMHDREKDCYAKIVSIVVFLLEKIIKEMFIVIMIKIIYLSRLIKK